MTVSATIEKIAADAARAMLQDPAFRAELKAVAAASMRDVRRQARPGRRKARR